jgi:hypothetical protein
MKKVLPIIIAVVLAGGIGFFAGTKVGATPAVTRGQFPGDGTERLGMGAARQNGLSGGFTGGEVIAIDATSMTVKMRDGGSKIVLLSGTTKVSRMADGALSDIATGTQVIVTGTANTDGSMVAESIQVRPVGTMPPASQ